MGDPKVTLVDYQVFGTPVYLGQACFQCEASHFCDMICFRFSPKSFQCVCCGHVGRHRKMSVLIKEYRLRQLMMPGA